MKKAAFLILLFASACTHRQADINFVPHEKIVMQAQMRTDTLTTLLALSDEQKTKVYAVILKEKEDEVAYKPLKSTHPVDFVLKKKEVIGKSYHDMKAVLSPEQQEKLDSYLPTVSCFRLFW